VPSASYAAETVGACRAARVRYSVTVRMNASVTKAITAIPEQDWRTIKYPQAVRDEEAEQCVSDAEIAETPTRRSPPRRSATRSPPG
jgi:hypothetical protein